LSFLRRRSEALGETSNIDRFQTAVDLWLAEAPYQAEPLFLSVGLENFLDLLDWNEANKLGVKYLRERALRKRLVFASAADIADYFQRHYRRQPETWLVWPDAYAGIKAGYKPPEVPLRIELSNARFHSLHEDGSAMPRFFWDFTHGWEEPVWDDQRAIRQKHGLVTPELLTADNCVPRMVDVSGVKAGVVIEPEADAGKPEARTTSGRVLVRVTVETSRRLTSLPLAVWRIPLAPDGLEVVAVPENVRFVPMVDGSTGNLHAAVVGERVSPGITVWWVHLRGTPRTPLDPAVQIGQHVRGRMFLRDATPFVYLWLADQSAPAGRLKVQVPTGRKAAVHYNDGKRDEASGGLLTVVLDREWQHESPFIAGLTAEELQSSAQFEPAR